MTPEQRIKAHILVEAIDRGDVEWSGDITSANVDETYAEELVARGLHWDYLYELRDSGEETDVPCEFSRHYKSKSVARKLHCGTWVGWTYWYGGGKHADPESIDWMPEAYELDVQEEQKVVTVRTFAKRQEGSADDA